MGSIRLPKPYFQDDAVTIYHGDCREIMPLLDSASFSMLWSDPPYGHSNQDGDLQSARVGVKGARQRESIKIQNDGPEEMREVVNFALTEAVRLLRNDCCCCCCGGGGPKPTFAWLAERMDKDGLSFFHATIWDKTKRGPGLGWRYRRDYEMVMVAHKRGGKLAWNEEEGAVSNILRFRPEKNDLHPTMKPTSMVEQFLRVHTMPGDLVIDPFAGSGTTGRAAKDMGRKAVLIELEEKYCEIAAKRMSQQVLNFGS